jgi:hypothetical protein
VRFVTAFLNLGESETSSITFDLKRVSLEVSSRRGVVVLDGFVSYYPKTEVLNGDFERLYFFFLLAAIFLVRIL